jgi:carboxyl-terminal processing protease
MKLLYLILLSCFACSTFAQTNQSLVTISPQIQNFAGICAIVRKTEDTNKIIIVETIKKGAADKAGLLANDEIIQIDSTKTDGKDIGAVVALLRGNPGSIVKLTIKRKGSDKPICIDVTRELVRLP